MKQKDMTLILVIIFISAIFSFVLSGVLVSGPKNRREKVEVVETISTDFPKPDSKYFNSQSNNPTQLIRISDNANNTPFNATSKP